MRASMVFTVPIRTQLTGNKRSSHWGRRKERVALERKAVGLMIDGPTLKALATIPRPLVVTLTRVWAPSAVPGGGQRELDGHDNLRQALKGVADEVAAGLGFENDRHPELAFVYAQARGDRPAVRVRIEGPCRVATIIQDV